MLTPAMAAPGGGGKLGGIFTPEQRAMMMLGARDQLKAMSQDDRKAWRRDQVARIMAMSPPERAHLQADLQAKWDALPQPAKDRIEQRIAMRAQDRDEAGPAQPAKPMNMNPNQGSAVTR